MVRHLVRHTKGKLVALKEYVPRSYKCFARFSGTNLLLSAGVLVEAKATTGQYASVWGDAEARLVEMEFFDDKVGRVLKLSRRTGGCTSVSTVGIVEWLGLDRSDYPDRLPVEIVGERRIRIDLSKPSALDA